MREGMVFFSRLYCTLQTDHNLGNNLKHIYTQRLQINRYISASLIGHGGIMVHPHDAAELTHVCPLGPGNPGKIPNISLLSSTMHGEGDEWAGRLDLSPKSYSPDQLSCTLVTLPSGTHHITLCQEDVPPPKRWSGTWAAFIVCQNSSVLNFASGTKATKCQQIKIVFFFYIPELHNWTHTWGIHPRNTEKKTVNI